MRKILEKLIVKNGGKICSLASIAALISLYSCRCIFFQPKEPDGMSKIVKKS